MQWFVSLLFPLNTRTLLTYPAVEELLVTSRTSLIFSDVGGSEARREARLHFLNSVPIDDLSILFFIDASAPLEELPCTLDELVYLVSYARSRGGHTKYLGIVINKQDLLTGAAGWHHISHGRASGLRKSGEADKEEDSERAAAVARITAGVEKAMEVVVKSPVMGRGVGEEVETSMKWEVLDGGRPGISAKTGTGVKEVFDTVSRAVFGNDRAGMGLLGIVTGGPTGLG